MINTTQNIATKHHLEHNLKANISCFRVNYYDKEGIWDQTRHLYWTEDNRLHTAVDNNYYSYYAYDHTGERTLKLTGKNTFMDVNGETQASASLNNVTLYVGPYLVATNQGYTKHYYNGTERICAKLGNGGLGNNLTSKNNYSTVADGLFSQCQTAMNGQSMKDEDQICITSLSGEWEQEMKLEDYKGKFTPIQPSLLSKISADVTTFGNTLASYKSSKSAKETNIYFYHSDHLGSASWITNGSGTPIQHLQYMPYGEPLVNERKSSYEERFTFTGKERDSETGFSYFGARYYDSDLMTGWLSVDPMADKYPNISPYAYCAWNPVRVIDPNGLDTVNIQYNSSEGRWICNEPIISEGSDVFNVTDASGNTSQTIFDNGDYGNRMNILLLEDNSVLDESFGVYHLSGTSEVGFVLQRSAKSEYHHNGEGTYSTYVGKGKHWFNYVGLSGNGATPGIRLHYGKDVSFSEGCILLAYSYTSNNCGKKFNLENSRQAISNFFTYAGALSKRENVLMSMKAGNTTRRKDLYNFGHNDSNFRNPSVIIKK